jgi:hypothetical protein
MRAPWSSANGPNSHVPEVEDRMGCWTAPGHPGPLVALYGRPSSELRGRAVQAAGYLVGVEDEHISVLTPTATRARAAIRAHAPNRRLPRLQPHLRAGCAERSLPRCAEALPRQGGTLRRSGLGSAGWAWAGTPPRCQPRSGGPSVAGWLREPAFGTSVCILALAVLQSGVPHPPVRSPNSHA